MKFFILKDVIERECIYSSRLSYLDESGSAANVDADERITPKHIVHISCNKKKQSLNACFQIYVQSNRQSGCLC